MTVFEVLRQLNATSSRNEKLAILQANVNNDLLKQVLIYALDPFKNYYIINTPAYEPDQPTMLTLDRALPLLDRLINREVTGNAALTYLKMLMSELSPEDASVIERVVKKDLRCGVSDSTVNKVWPDLIPTFPCMLCSAYDEKLVAKIAFPAYVQLKMDGMRFNAIVKSGRVEFRSRNGKELNLLGHLEQEFIQAAHGADVVFDGELLIEQPDGTIAPRQTGNGILSKANKGTLSAAEAQQVRASLWDMVGYSEFIAGRSKVPYSTRFSALVTALGNANIDKLRVVQSTTVANIDQAQQLFSEALASGQEGIILKDPNGVWENKRAKHQIKFKGEFECDLRIVGWEEGTGKNAGRLGALVLESEDGIIKTNVGTGFTDADREQITREVIGQVCSVKYNGRIVDKKTGVQSLFLPVFVSIRFDKDHADTADLIV